MLSHMGKLNMNVVAAMKYVATAFEPIRCQSVVGFGTGKASETTFPFQDKMDKTR